MNPNNAPKLTRDEITSIWPTKNSTRIAESADTVRIAAWGTWRLLIVLRNFGSWRSRLIE
jgi:hypothetical protein